MKKSAAYREAERKIELARISGDQELDLSANWGADNSTRLNMVPESIGQLTLLRSLDLSRNQLSALPESLGNLSNLQSLSLYGNAISELPNSFEKLKNLELLDLSLNELTVLPAWLGKLSKLKELELYSNHLSELPESLSKLTKLQVISISSNRLTKLPEWLIKLTHLKSIDIANNQLTALPKWIDTFSNLKYLNVGSSSLKDISVIGALQSLDELILGSATGSCAFTELPSEIRALKQLKSLWLFSCGLCTLPDWIGELSALNELHLGFNQLSEIPSTLGSINSLSNLLLNRNLLKDIPHSLSTLELSGRLSLDDNPLNPELAAAYAKGHDSVKRYLRELSKGAKNRYEAKLLILGDGNEGKTCVSRALRRLSFRKQNSTHGVDVEQWQFPHPDYAADASKKITLNIWDFEGQEITHQTHQFFLTSQSLYLLVFKCRDLFLLDRAEYWLDTIRSRAPKAKVVIVISQCEERSPVVPLDRIQAQYGDLLAEKWFFPVGCKNGFNVSKLTEYLQRLAADMEFMGSPWPISNAKAEEAIKRRAKRGTAYISRDQLYKVFTKAEVSSDGYEDAASRLSRLGALTQFPDCPDLRDFIVLRPQWLTKAISKVMEDKKLSEDRGEISFQRMEAMWHTDYSSMYATFHDCMKEFELCYDLEDGDRCCLVPLRFGYLRPDIPWTNCQNMKERRVEYKLSIRPPMGIMSRFIVKTHHMIVKTAEHPKGIYWHNGVFLFSGEGALRSEALCEFVPEERKLRIEVRAAYPQNMCEQIHAYVKAVFSFFSGLEAERSYGCIKVDKANGAEERCAGLHTEKRIYSAISKQRVLDCEFEDHDIDPNKLIWGFSSFNEFVKDKMVSLTELRRELDKQPVWAEPYLNSIGTLLTWLNANGGKMDQLLLGQSALSAEFKQEAELKLQQYLALTSELLDDRDYTAAPGLISISTKDRNKWNPKNYFNQTYLLTPYCECPGHIHSCLDAQVEFSKDRAWWARSAPWIARGTKLLSAGLQLAFAGMPLALGKDAFEALKDDVEFMDKLAEKMDLEEGNEEALADIHDAADLGRIGVEDDRESRLTRTALAHLLEELAPNNYRARQWGSLRRIKMSDNSHRWLCTDCAKSCR